MVKHQKPTCIDSCRYDVSLSKDYQYEVLYQPGILHEYGSLLVQHFGKRSVAILTDLGGFVASAYMRGIAYTNFGTSLLAQLDSCVGGKVALNKGLISDEIAESIFEMLHSYDLLEFSEPINPDHVAEHAAYVRLVRGNQLHFVLPYRRIGEVTITNDVTNTDLVNAFVDYEEIIYRKKNES